MDTELLKELGLTKAAKTVEAKLELKKKLTIAYENYRFVTPEIANRFQEELKKKTYHIQQNDGTWKKATEADLNKRTMQNVKHDILKFMKLSEYGEVPPMEALTALKEAKDRGCFDAFEVAKIDSVVKVEDPIIFGCINGCEDKFFITQWDNDIKIEDILKENEG